MRFGRLAILALICCMAIQENFTHVANSLAMLAANPAPQDHIPAPDAKRPRLPQGAEIEWLIADCADVVCYCFTHFPDWNPFLGSVLRDRTLANLSSSTELLYTLQRLRI
jgi:hypothetical protein